MPCKPLEVLDADGQVIGSGFACSRGGRVASCSSCGARSNKLCDYPLVGAKAGKTCDRQLCRRCAVRQPGKDRDYCPAHAKAAAP